MLAWRQGHWDEAIGSFRRAYELGEQVGRSEVAFSALQWLAWTLRESGDLAAAETDLAKALDICERAGLIAQSVEAISARAVLLAMQGRTDQARAAADEADRLAGRIHYPVGDAAKAEAAGACAEDPDRGGRADGRGAAALAGAGPARSTRRAACWCAAGSWPGPIPRAAARVLADAAAEYEALDVPALATGPANWWPRGERGGQSSSMTATSPARRRTRCCPG